MHFRLLILLLLMLAAPTFALAEDTAAGHNLIARLLGAIIDNTGDELDGDDNVVETYNVDGNGKVVMIDELVLTINVGDVALNRQGGGEEFIHRLLDLFEQQGPGRPDRDRGFSFFPPHGPNFREMDHGQTGPEQYQRFLERPRRPLKGGEPHPGFDGRRAEMMEMMMSIPPDVDLEYVRWIMHIGRLAWEFPEFRERLEVLVQKAEKSIDANQR